MVNPLVDRSSLRSLPVGSLFRRYIGGFCSQISFNVATESDKKWPMDNYLIIAHIWTITLQPRSSAHESELFKDGL